MILDKQSLVTRRRGLSELGRNCSKWLLVAGRKCVATIDAVPGEATSSRNNFGRAVSSLPISKAEVGLELTPVSAVNLSVRSPQWAGWAVPVVALVCQHSAPS